MLINAFFSRKVFTLFLLLRQETKHILLEPANIEVKLSVKLYVEMEEVLLGKLNFRTYP